MATEEHALILFPELSDGGQIKVVHFDTKICQGDFGCNERSFLEVMQKQWKHFWCAFRCRLGVRNEHTTNHPFGVLKLVLSYLKQHRQDAFKGRRFFHYPPEAGCGGWEPLAPKKGKNPPPSLKPSVMHCTAYFLQGTKVNSQCNSSRSRVSCKREHKKMNIFKITTSQ